MIRTEAEWNSSPEPAADACTWLLFIPSRRHGNKPLVVGSSDNLDYGS